MSATEQHLELLNRLVDYLEGRTSLAALEEWLAPLTVQVMGRGPWPLDHLLQAVELGLAEYTAGHRSEVELREQLASLARNCMLELTIDGGQEAPMQVADTTSSVISDIPPFTAGEELSSLQFGTQFATAFV
ncbi:MAG TPA: hypothetical protein VFD49_20365 [Candidatus Dormibacteraeota bacterium]|nr:hypothetical protein [Candidatus Dormibacteraeota bacterium]